MAETVGFIGLGLMGKPMAKNLLQARVHARRAQPQPRAGRRAGGGRSRTQPRRPPTSRDASPGSSPCCPTARTWNRCSRGPTASSAPFSADTILIDCSSIAPRPRTAAGRACRELGASMLDAPVSGGEIGAINARCRSWSAATRRRSHERQADPRRDGQPRAHRPHRRVRRRADLQGLQPDGDRRRARRRQRGVRARAEGRRRCRRACARRCSAASPRAACSKCTASGCCSGNYKPGFRAAALRQGHAHRRRRRSPSTRRRRRSRARVQQLVTSMVAARARGRGLFGARHGGLSPGWPRPAVLTAT